MYKAPQSKDQIDIPVLPVDDLYKKRQSRDAARLRAYNELLDKIYHRIRVVSKSPTHPTQILYTIPPFILGVPRLDLQDCVVYLVYQLRNGGFEVKFTYPNMLGISWAHHEKDYIANESPILQAMMATTPQPQPDEPKRGMAPKKSALKKSSAPPPIDIYRMSGNAAPLNATDYHPPSGFIQAIERPAPAASRGNIF
jgi:hypothetical protein